MPKQPSKDKPDYEVGFGKPPKHSRWVKGRSGNPKGRKKGARGLKTDLDKALKEQLTVRVNGKQRKGTLQAHAIYAPAIKAAAGDMRASKQLTDLTLAIFGHDDRGGGRTQLSKLDQELLERALVRSADSRKSDETPKDSGLDQSLANEPVTKRMDDDEPY
jgi:hypothetical protein